MMEQNFDTWITPLGMRLRRSGLSKKLAYYKKRFVTAFHLVRLSMRQEAYGLALGHLWLLLEPALLAFTYYLLIKVIFGVSGSDMNFAFFFTAITFWRSHAVMVAGAPMFFVTRAQPYIQQGMGLDIAYLEQVVYEFILFLLRLCVLGFFLIATGVTPSWFWIFAPFVGALQFVFTMACVVWLSYFGAIIRDMGRFVAHVVWLWWYMSPGLYSIGRIPEWARPFYDLNPFAHLIPATHTLLLKGEFPSEWAGLLAVFFGSGVVLMAGIFFLKKHSYRLYRFI